MLVLEIGVVLWRSFVSTLFATHYSGTTRITYSFVAVNSSAGKYQLLSIVKHSALMGNSISSS